MADAFDCGRYTHECWKRGAEHVVRHMGSYNAQMQMSDVHAVLEHEKLTDSFREGFERGWRSVSEPV